MALTNQDQYQHEPLDASIPSIRLCKLLSGATDDPIECELLQVNLESVHNKYNALSYTWGDPEERPYITVNGKPFPIQPNLMAALVGLRKVEEELIIWIDALCINQQNISEVNRQVAMMEQIYRNAIRVLVWLGPEADSSHAAFKFFNEFALCLGQRDGIGQFVEMIVECSRLPALTKAGAKFQKSLQYIQQLDDELTADPLKTARFLMQSEEYHEAVESAHLPESTKDDAEIPKPLRLLHQLEEVHVDIDSAIRLICQREYWSRAWIVQEIILAKSAVLHCGNDSADWSAVGLLLAIRPIQQQIVHGGTPHIYGNLGRRFYVNRFAYHTKDGHRNGEKLASLLQANLHAMCRNPRDRVFSLLSLASDCIGREKDLVDYAIAIPDLFLAVLNFCQPKRVVHFASLLQTALHISMLDLVFCFIPTTPNLPEAKDGRTEGQEALLQESANASYLQRLATEFKVKLMDERRCRDRSVSLSEEEIREYCGNRASDGRGDDHKFSWPSEAEFFRICGIAEHGLDSRCDEAYILEGIGLGLIFRPTLLGNYLRGFFRSFGDHGKIFEAKPLSEVLPEGQLDNVRLFAFAIWRHLHLSSPVGYRKVSLNHA